MMDVWPYKHQTLKDGSGEVLVSDYEFMFKYKYSVMRLLLKAPFVWDGASIPRFFWRIIGSPLKGRYQRASLVHDYLYVFRKAVINGVEHEVDRRWIDYIFRAIMKHDGVGFFRRWLMWFAVRVGGWRVWNKRDV